jgi:hypothetical protein
VAALDEAARLRLAQRLFRERDLQAGALDEQGDRDTAGQPQGVHHELEDQVLAPDLAAFLDGTAFARSLEVLLGLLPTGAARHAIRKAEVVAEAPVVEIVAALAPGLRPGRGLVVNIAGPRERRGDRFLHRGGGIVVGQRRRVPEEVRVRLDREVVEGQVRHARRDRRGDIRARLVRGLARQRVHQVEVDVVEVLARDLDRAPRLGLVVDAPQRRQVPGIEALDSDREARHAGVAIAAELLRLEGPRIRFQRDLAVGVQGEPGAERRDQRPDRLGGKQAGRAAAEEYARDWPPPDLGQRLLEVAHQSVHVRVFGNVPPHLVGIEVAIRALPDAPRYVNVERKGREVLQAHPHRRHRHDGGRGAHTPSFSFASSLRIALPRWLTRFF